MTNTGGSEPTRLIRRHAADHEGALAMVWSPDATRVAFTDYTPEGHVFLYAMNADGSALVELSAGLSDADDPTWSPDGTMIAFTGFDGDHGYEIYVVCADGTGLSRLTDEADNGVDGAHMPAWSPDGTRIAYSANRYDEATQTETQAIFVIATDGSGQVQVTDGSAIDESPIWSPDSTRIAFSRKAGEDAEVFVTNPDGSGLVNVSNHPALDWAASWSPDGTSILLVSRRGGDYDLYLAGVNGGSLTRLTAEPSDDLAPVWAPDGTRIAFASDREGSFDLFVMDADGTAVTRVTEGTDDEYPQAWLSSTSSASPSPGFPEVSNVELPSGLVASRLTIGAGSVWALASTGRTGSAALVRIDPATGRVAATTSLAADPWYVAAGVGAVWVGFPSSSVIYRIDAATNEVTGQIPLPGDGIGAIAADESAVWVEVFQDRSDQGEQNLASLLRIDPQTSQVVATIPLDGLSGYDDEIAIGAGAIWVAGVNLIGPSEERGADLVRIDPLTDTISARLPVSAFSVRAGTNAVWVTSPADGVNDSLHKPEDWVGRSIDPISNEISAPIQLPGNVSGLLAVTADGVWFSGYDEDGLIHPVRLQNGAFDASVPPINAVYTDMGFDEATGAIWVAATSGLTRAETG